ncbi:MAG: hypothetical protein RQ758_06145 [Methanomicrobiaceae archaeon]|nr:hypothetical protein [Methanomicrobiaceae archaeon]
MDALAMDIWTILVSGGFGVALLLLPEMVQETLGYPGRNRCCSASPEACTSHSPLSPSRASRLR